MKINLPDTEKLKKRLMNLPVISQIISYTKTHSLPGFFSVPIYDVIIFIRNELRRYDLTVRANAVSFSFFLALFPAIIALFTILPYLTDFIMPYFPEGQSFQTILRNQIMEIVPGQTGSSLSAFILDIVEHPRVGLTSVGFILAILFASNGMIGVMRSFNKSYSSTFKRRSGLRKRLVAIKMVGILAMMVVASLLLVILGNLLINTLANLLNLDQSIRFLLLAVRWIVIIALYYFGIATLYRQGASTIRKFKYITPGATVATLLSVLSSLVFSFFVDNFGMYNTLYGSIGTIIVSMLWIQINSFLILLGYELNASIAVNRDLKEHIKEDED